MQVSTPRTKRLCNYVTISAPLSLQISWLCNSLWRHRRTCLTVRCDSRAYVTPSGTYTLSFFFFFFFFFFVLRAMLNGQAGCNGKVGRQLKEIHPTPQFLPQVHRLGPGHTPSLTFRHLPPNSAKIGYTTEGTLLSPCSNVHRRGQRPPKGLGTDHTPSTAFRHLPPNSARFSYATEGVLFISARLSSDAVSALRKVWVLIRLEAT